MAAPVLGSLMLPFINWRGLFVLLGWVTVTTPSWACVGLSALLLAATSVFRPRQLGDALHRRLQA